MSVRSALAENIRPIPQLLGCSCASCISGAQVDGRQAVAWTYPAFGADKPLTAEDVWRDLAKSYNPTTLVFRQRYIRQAPAWMCCSILLPIPTRRWYWVSSRTETRPLPRARNSWPRTRARKCGGRQRLSNTACWSCCRSLQETAGGKRSRCETQGSAKHQEPPEVARDGFPNYGDKPNKEAPTSKPKYGRSFYARCGLGNR